MILLDRLWFEDMSKKLIRYLQELSSRWAFRKELGKFLFPMFTVSPEFCRGRVKIFPEFPVKVGGPGKLKLFSNYGERLTGLKQTECRRTKPQLIDIAVRRSVIDPLPILIERCMRKTKLVRYSLHIKFFIVMMPEI